MYLGHPLPPASHRARPITTFDRYIIRRLLGGFVLLVLLLIVFFIVLHYVEYMDDFFDRGATFRQVFFTYYPSYVPEIVKLTSPLALFIAAIYFTGQLAQSLQLQALQTSGVSLYRLMVPFLVVGLLVTGFMFWFNGWVVPVTNRTVLAFEQQYLKDAPRQLDTNNIHRQDRPGRMVTVGFYDRSADVAHRVSIHTFDDDRRLRRRLDAQRMTWVDSLRQWHLSDVVERTFDGLGRETRRAYPALDTVLQVTPREFARTERDVESMTIPAAAAYLDELRRTGVSNLGRSRVGYYVKYAYPLANLVLVFLAVPLAAVRRRGGQAVQLGIGLAVAFVYLAFQKLTEPFGYTGALDPLVTAWLPHGAFLLLGLVLLLRARK